MRHLHGRSPLRIAVAAGLLAALAGPASAEGRDNLRIAPAGCRSLADRAVGDLRETDRRLERTRNGPGDARRRAEILSGVLDDPNAKIALSKLLNCLAGRN